MRQILPVKLLDHAAGLDLPRYATCGSAGIDLVAAVTQNIVIPTKEYIAVPTGICIELNEGYEAQVRPRSGLAAKYGVTVLNSPGTIDSDYRGEIKVLLINHGKDDFIIERGMRIAQLVISRYIQVELCLEKELGLTKRGDNGFGSTGKF